MFRNIICCVIAVSTATLLPDQSLAQTKEQQMDALLATYQFYADAKDRAEAVPRLVAIWQGISDCVDAVDVGASDASVCVARVHQTCVAGDWTDFGQRPCWDDEFFAWRAERKEVLAALKEQIRKEAADGPESFPKISADQDYSADHLFDLLQQSDAAADKFAELNCAIEVGVLGYDPNRGTPPLNAINTSYACPIDAEALQAWRYIRWNWSYRIDAGMAKSRAKKGAKP